MRCLSYRICSNKIFVHSWNVQLFYFSYLSNDYSRMNNSANVRSYRDSGYQQPHPQSQRADNYNNQNLRRSNNFAGSNSARGRRGTSSNSYRSGAYSDVGTGGKFN